MPFTYPYPRPAVTCDVVAFTIRAGELALLLIRRKDEPFRGKWALPGGFVNENEPLDRAASRELYEETGLSGVRLEQVGTFGDPGRDPRGHTVSVAYVTFLVAEATIVAGDDAAEAQWHPLRSLVLDATAADKPATKKSASRRTVARRSTPPRAGEPIRLAFDHAKIITQAYRRLCRHLDDPVRDLAFDLVPPRFTLAELQHLYEVIFGRKLSARAFKNLLVERGLVVPTTKKPAPKPATQLYRWNRR